MHASLHEILSIWENYVIIRVIVLQNKSHSSNKYRAAYRVIDSLKK